MVINFMKPFLKRATSLTEKTTKVVAIKVVILAGIKIAG